MKTFNNSWEKEKGKNWIIIYEEIPMAKIEREERNQSNYHIRKASINIYHEEKKKRNKHVIERKFPFWIKRINQDELDWYIPNSWKERATEYQCPSIYIWSLLKTLKIVEKETKYYCQSYTTTVTRTLVVHHILIIKLYPCEKDTVWVCFQFCY